ncbi:MULTISPECIES: DMT family transporter [unclassified Bacillus (in: firmicutes)]|uniref:DMT family transporter n=1 Tax=unclassified Bacillus (in: firmicutes) TaxID=185979 RepID=UPI0008EBD1FE|nr:MULTISPECIES: DMT family transporter [unclassified Bacillus (in: firmicutes)]SFJ39720.1 Permease of the drug/metabolite transporter (DMT) superfamily [Bacillus sp. 71mf]SFT14906.1 Permease of the drug/metabolite transporter (DMT) superfamily [Bacillus sp. 103mf]
MKAERFFTHPLGVFVAALSATFLWGSAFPFIKLSYVQLDIQPHEVGEQILFAGYRFFLAGMMLLFFFKALGRNVSFQKGTTKQLVQIGLFQTFLQYVCFYIGLSYSTGIEGAVISGTSSFFQIVLAHFLYKDDSLNMRKIVGVSIGFCGVILVNIPKGNMDFHFGIGELLLLSAAMLYSYGNILAKEGSKTMDVGYMTAYQMIIGSLGLLFIGILQVGLMPFTFHMQTLLMLLYLSFLSAAGFCIWNTVMKYNKVGKVSMYMFFIPVFGVILSSLILGEAIHSFVLFGLACVATGIIIVNRTRSERNASHAKSSAM